MGDIQVTYAEMEDSARKLETAKTEIVDKLTNLNNMINQLTQGAFKTESASPKFQESFGKWHGGAKSAIEGIEGMSAFLKKAVQGHRELDQNLSSGISQ